MAWELPHRPIALEDVLAGTTAYQSPPAPPPPPPMVEPVQQPVMTRTPLVYASLDDQLHRRRQDSYYFGSVNAAGGGWRRNATQPFGNRQRTASPNVNGYHWSDNIDRVDVDWQRYNQFTSQATSTTTTTPPGDPNAGRDIIISDNYPFIRKRPIIALPLGKRSVPEETAYGRHHRESRYELYRLIEMFLNA